MITIVRPFKVTQLKGLDGKRQPDITPGAYYAVIAIDDDEEQTLWMVRNDKGQPLWFDPDFYAFAIVDEWRR